MRTAPQDYRATISVTTSKAEAFHAVTSQMAQWWTTPTEGELAKVGDTATVRFLPEYGFWTFEATVVEPEERLEMLCVDAHHKVEGQPEAIDREWLGTRIIWEFKSFGDETEVSMINDGLPPELNCWGICLDGWDHFFKNSLKAFLNGESPSPHSVT